MGQLTFVNVFPKSGTWLIAQMLSGVTKHVGHISQFNENGEEVPITNILEKIRIGKELANGPAFMTGHLHYNYRVKMALEGWKQIMVVRDLRGVAVSHAHYVTKDPEHWLHDHYNKLLDIEARIRTSITGTGEGFPDIGQRFLPYVPWFGQEEVYGMDFKMLRENEFMRFSLADFLGLPKGVDLDLLKNVDPEKSFTFRRGDPDSWKEEMSEANQHLFNDIAGWTKEIIHEH